MDQDWASLFEHKDMEESWTILKSKVKQAVSASTPVCENLKRQESKITIEDTSGRSYQIKERSMEKIQRQQI